MFLSIYALDVRKNYRKVMNMEIDNSKEIKGEKNLNWIKSS